MKKINLLTSILAFIVFSCNKESIKVESQKNTISKEISTNDKHVVFNTIQEFNDFLDKTSNEEITIILNKIEREKFITYHEKISKEKTQEDLVGDEFLSKLLNEDLIIQIEDYLFRINKNSSKVYVLQANKEEYYSDLVSENISNKFILEFSTEDDVLGLIDENIEKAMSKKCSSSDQRTTGWDNYGKLDPDVDNIYGKGRKKYNFEAKLTVRYDNWGIYRKLFTEFNHNEKWGGLWDEVYFTVAFQYSYTTKNGSTGGSTQYLTVDPITSPSYTGKEKYPFLDDKKEFIHYRGTKCLSSYELKSVAVLRNGATLKPRYLPNDGSYLKIIN